jgi:gamma-glutamylputrescine oxidase
MGELVDTFYARSNTAPKRAALREVVQADVCVIGGGMAGLATALDLAERGQKVVLLERHRVGFGASGRNGGFVSPGFPGGLPALKEKVGLQAARELFDLSRAAQRLVRNRIDRYGMQVGRVVDHALRCGLAGSKESLQAFCDEMARDFGVEYEYWPRARLAEALSSPQYGEAFLNTLTFSLDPLALTRATALAAEGLGVRIFEQTPATSLNGRTVHTPGGRVEARHVVLAGGGYIGMLNWTVGLATIPIATFVMTTEPLGNRLAEAIRVDYAISDIKTATNYYRTTADGRVVWGGRVLAWEPPAARVAEVLKRDMGRFYPALADARVEVAWGGMMPYLRHKTPVVGQIADGLWVATGFGGLGMALTTIAGACWPASACPSPAASLAAFPRRSPIGATNSMPGASGTDDFFGFFPSGASYRRLTDARRSRSRMNSPADMMMAAPVMVAGSGTSAKTR